MKKLSAQKAGVLFWFGEVLLFIISMFVMFQFGFLWQIAFYIVSTVVWAIFVEQALTDKSQRAKIQTLFGG